jgi:hypothetical protein
MPTRFNLPHIDIAARKVSQEYTGPRSNIVGSPRERREHGRRLRRELAAALTVAETLRPDDPRLPDAEGSVIEVVLRKGTKPDALDMKRERVRSGAAQIEENNQRSVLLFVPDDAKAAFEQIVADYLTKETPQGNPVNKAKVEAIESFRAARLERFWTDDPAALPERPQARIWWGLWCFKDSVEQVQAACADLDLRIAADDRWMHFPETVVIPVYATRAAIELVLFATSAISELRRASDSPVFFTDDVEGDQHPWVRDLARRIDWPGLDAPAVCVIDTGANRGHALLEPALAPDDMHAIDRAWGVDDHHERGHGTSMAGLALHGDLTAALADRGRRVLTHRIETVKILPPDAFDPTEPRSYGPFTQSAISLPEIAAPERSRVFCMAVTNENVSGNIPSAWSAAVDQAAAGTMAGDDEDAPKRLILLSGGNIPPELNARRVQPQDNYPIEDPAQAWNALTVGGSTDLIDVHDAGYETWTAVAEAGDLSPHSRTSATWRNGTPFKPEIVMEAGNRALSPSRREMLTLDSLSLLAVGKDAATPLVAFDGTSAATAQAARLAARVSADHPDFWPEMVRGLIVHSAEWTDPMRRALDARNGRRERYELIRRFGYGVPSYERATASAVNDLALMAQAEIQPFRLQGQRKFNECHYYDLPIPRGMLEDLENNAVELKITLSYFIDPNPGLGANVDPQRYRSHGLRFDLRRKGETVDRFKRRVNAAELEEGDERPRADGDDAGWMLGERSVSAGSLHCDVWTGPAIELAGRDMLCIKPVNGWCRNRSTREVCNTLRRYALIVSLKTRNTEIDIYTQIRNVIDATVDIESLI